MVSSQVLNTNETVDLEVVDDDGEEEKHSSRGDEGYEGIEE